jgi:hypothetical protein
MNYLKTFKLVAFLLTSIIFLGCSGDKDNASPQETSKISVKLMDNPGDYDNVFVEVEDVMVNYNADQNDNNGWQSIDAINTGIYDLLELTGGVNVLLSDNYEVPAGELKQIRLILGQNNSIVIDGETFPLRTPSAQQSGLKIQVNEYLEPNLNYTFLLDFDVDESILLAGNSDNIILKPTLRASIEASSGIIAGSVTQLDVAVEITATNGIDIVSSFTDADGNFVLVGLTEGIYTVTLTPSVDSGLSEQVIEGVEVIVGETTSLGLINLD